MLIVMVLLTEIIPEYEAVIFTLKSPEFGTPPTVTKLTAI